jgi:hypothetical protein
VNPILEAALEVQRFCQSRRWRFCIIGEDARSLPRLRAILDRAAKER